MPLIMLKNPVHFLRKDAKTLEYPLFTAYYYQRDPNTVKKINEAVSYRFLLLNESITHVPQQYHKLLRSSFFTAKQRLDFRLESPFTDYPRLQVAAGTTDLNAVMRHKITRKIKYPALELFEKHAKRDTDTIFIAKPYALFASSEEIQKETEVSNTIVVTAVLTPTFPEAIARCDLVTCSASFFRSVRSLKT